MFLLTIMFQKLPRVHLSSLFSRKVVNSSLSLSAPYDCVWRHHLAAALALTFYQLPLADSLASFLFSSTVLSSVLLPCVQHSAAVYPLAALFHTVDLCSLQLEGAFYKGQMCRVTLQPLGIIGNFGGYFITKMKIK